MRQKGPLCILLLSLALFTALPVFGSTIKVTNTNDSGPGSLREAIGTATSRDTITFRLAYPATITLSSPLVIGTDLTVSGPGAPNLAISGNDAVEVFSISSGVTVSLTGVTIENGVQRRTLVGGGISNYGALTISDSTLSGNSAPIGGGIYSDGTLTITNSTISVNSAESGGGIYSGDIYHQSGATLTITNSTISGNVASSNGGISNYGALTITNSTVSDNYAGVDCDAGGIFNGYHAAITSTTVSGNLCDGGGGILNGNGGTLTITNSTIWGNTGEFLAGIGNEGTLTITNSTISENGSFFSGGIFSRNALTIKSTIVAMNFGRDGKSGSEGNCNFGGEVTSDGYNLSDGTSCSNFLTSRTDSNNTFAGLDPAGLQDNGGPTKTIALLSSSPAVDAIPPANCTLPDGITPVATDQRGITRPQGPACDIGAFELVNEVPFSSFKAKLDVDPGSIRTRTLPNFDLNSTFTLGVGSNGINPLTEVVKLQVGTYQVTIPSGSFQQLEHGPMRARFAFSGAVGGVSLSIQILPLARDTYRFKAEGSPVDLTALTNSVTVTLTIGDDAGTVPADF